LFDHAKLNFFITSYVFVIFVPFLDVSVGFMKMHNGEQDSIIPGICGGGGLVLLDGLNF